MTSQGYRNRIYSIEWHAELWRRIGHPRDLCEAVMRHASSCVEADYYGELRPLPDTGDRATNEICRDAEAYFDRVFDPELRGPTSFA